MGLHGLPKVFGNSETTKKDKNLPSIGFSVKGAPDAAEFIRRIKERRSKKLKQKDGPGNQIS